MYTGINFKVLCFMLHVANFQFGNAWILWNLSVEGIATAYSTTSSMLMFSQALMMLEILHCAVGLVKGGIITVFLQVCLPLLLLNVRGCGAVWACIRTARLLFMQICNKLSASVPVLFKRKLLYPSFILTPVAMERMYLYIIASSYTDVERLETL